MNATLTAPHVPTPEQTRSGWDSRVFVLRAEDQKQLRARAEELVAFLDDEPATNLRDLASSLAAELQPTGLGLAIVAVSISDLQTKLRKALARLAGPDCKLIRDSSGTYFTAEPLFPTGQLALLFPGEGAQYPDMLADLCTVFPEVEETFAWCDQLAAEIGRPHDSLRNILHLPVAATPEDRLDAEKQLRRLGPSIFGVLIADLALTRLLQNLELPVACVAGHSAGELAALLAGGALRSDKILGPKLAEIMDLMQAQEDETGGPEIGLLAIGAGKETVAEIARVVAGDAVYIAMDNCPHQSVAVGPSELVDKVEAALLERGLVCEKLPFRRPYHTPLFEPWMGPYRAIFDTIPFENPHTPIYCCSTGRRFPADTNAIRELTVNHWISPVEFTRMIESMYADGVRLFIEAGPRGNLSAFTEDILRGKRFAAIPANLPRKSGPTQINHLIAQLMVHQVPLNLQHLFATQEADSATGDPTHTNRVTRAPDPDELHQDLSNGHGREVGFSRMNVLNGYFEVMEKFLDVQRSVMADYFGRSGSRSSEDLQLNEFTLPDWAPRADAHHYAMLGRIEELQPGHHVVARRALDEREDLYADHHTLAGRGVSRVDPGQNGLPVLPMTFSIEAMAEAASLLAPGKVVVAVRKIRLSRWLPFDPEPTTLEVRATVVDSDATTGVVEVKADVRDLGNSFLKDGTHKIAAEAVIVLADRYPEPPEPLAFQLTDEQTCRSTVEDLRRNMFHGPLFQMLRELVRYGKEGIEGTLEVQPRHGWFRSNPEPNIVLDPVLIDAAMHILGAWHLEQPDWTGRILLPFEVQSIEFFGPTPPVGSSLITRGHNEQESARHFRHGLEILDQDQNLWLRMTGAGYWRFYLPFGHVNFFGPKDEYFLSRAWPEAVSSGPERNLRCCYFLDIPADLKQPVLRAAGARVTLTPRELQEFRTWVHTDAELNSWFFGRLVAKDAVRAAWMRKFGEAIFPADLETELRDQRIECRPRDAIPTEPFPTVSVAQANDRIVAFAAFAPAVGVAVLAQTPDEPLHAAFERAACQAVADAYKIAVERVTATVNAAGAGEYLATVPREAGEHHSHGQNRVVRVQTASDNNFLVATTCGEVVN